MRDDFCLIHGYDYMMREFGNPIPHCTKCEDEREAKLATEALAEVERHGTTSLADLKAELKLHK